MHDPVSGQQSPRTKNPGRSRTAQNSNRFERDALLAEIRCDLLDHSFRHIARHRGVSRQTLVRLVTEDAKRARTEWGNDCHTPLCIALDGVFVRGQYRRKRGLICVSFSDSTPGLNYLQRLQPGGSQQELVDELARFLVEPDSSRLFRITTNYGRDMPMSRALPSRRKRLRSRSSGRCSRPSIGSTSSHPSLKSCAAGRARPLSPCSPRSSVACRLTIVGLALIELEATLVVTLEALILLTLHEVQIAHG
jgi:hypothetical protein